MKQEKLKNRGITLIALIITIIVMLILVGVTVNLALRGGLIEKAQEAKTRTQYEEDKEMLLASVIGAIDDDVEVDYEKLDRNLPEGFTKAEDGGYTSKAGNTFYVDEDGNIGSEKPQPKPTIYITENCEGYYADLNGDLEPDGIIYADLAIGSSGPQTWGTSQQSQQLGVYEYSKDTEDLKAYIKEADQVASVKFGNYKAPMVKLAEEQTGTNDRFYVMALEDVDKTTHTWYKSASGSLANPVGNGDNDFSKGKVYTEDIYDPDIAAKYRAFRLK